MKKEIIVHLKVDTGLGRLGVSPQEAFHLATQIQNTPWLKLGGVFTHFAAAFKDRVYTKKQLHILLQLRESFRTQGWNGVLWHAANSAAFLWLQESHLDFVRIGTLLYGQSPLPLDQTWSLQESWECKTRLIQVHTLPKGRSIGYGRGYTTKHPTIVGVIPVGYSHGLEVEPQSGPFNQLKQALSKVIKGQELVWHGPDSLPIVGRISMGLTCLDLNKKPHLKVGDELKVLMRRVTASNELPRLYYLNSKEHCVFWKHKVYRRGCILTNLNDLFGSESLPDQRFGPAKHNHFDQ